jgi:hypothetical protein
MPESLNTNNVSLAGEFAVLSQLALRGYEANMTLGNTKSVDILCANPQTGRMLRIEVKTNYQNTRSGGSHSRDFGNFVSGWMMNEKHEKICEENLAYCFVNISKDTTGFRFYIVPSSVVADYVKRQHEHWLASNKARKNNKVRMFRLGRRSDEYPIPTPIVEDYEDNWEFKALI